MSAAALRRALAWVGAGLAFNGGFWALTAPAPPLALVALAASAACLGPAALSLCEAVRGDG